MAWTSKRLPLPDKDALFARADLQFHELRHGGASYEGRVFLNRTDVTLRTPTRLQEGYGGSLYVFGHPHCWGDAGHCEVPPGPLHGFDHRDPHHLVPQLHVLDVTEAVRRLLEGRSRSVTVTVLPVTREKGRRRIDDSQLRFERLALVTYDHPSAAEPESLVALAARDTHA